MKKMLIKLRSFYVLWIKNQRYKGSVSNLKLFEVYFENELPLLQRKRG